MLWRFELIAASSRYTCSGGSGGDGRRQSNSRKSAALAVAGNRSISAKTRDHEMPGQGLLFHELRLPVQMGSKH